MEVYSIITDPQEIEYDSSSPRCLLRKAFARNKYLLTKYAPNFQHITSRQFRQQVRLVLKQPAPPTMGYGHRYSSRQITDSNDKSKESLGLLLPLNLKASSLNDRPSVLRNVQNLCTIRTKIDKPPPIESRRAFGLQINYKLKKIRLGEDLEKQCDQKIQSFLSNRYKSTVARLKNLYASSKAIPGPSYFINSSLAGFITKNLAKH